MHVKAHQLVVLSKYLSSHFSMDHTDDSPSLPNGDTAGTSYKDVASEEQDSSPS